MSSHLRKNRVWKGKLMLAMVELGETARISPWWRPRLPLSNKTTTFAKHKVISIYQSTKTRKSCQHFYIRKCTSRPSPRLTPKTLSTSSTRKSKSKKSPNCDFITQIWSTWSQQIEIGHSMGSESTESHKLILLPKKRKRKEKIPMNHRLMRMSSTLLISDSPKLPWVFMTASTSRRKSFRKCITMKKVRMTSP